MDLIQAENEPGYIDTVTWAGRPYPCVFEIEEETEQHSGLGDIPERSARLILRKSVLEGRKAPKVGDVVDVRAMGWRIRGRRAEERAYEYDLVQEDG